MRAVLLGARAGTEPGSAPTSTSEGPDCAGRRRLHQPRLWDAARDPHRRGDRGMRAAPAGCRPLSKSQGPFIPGFV